jgi:hypothetical protein
MPRFIVERALPGTYPAPDDLVSRCLGSVQSNSELGVSWLFSYVATDGACSYCVCEAPDADTIRLASQRSGLPVDKITSVTTLVPPPRHVAETTTGGSDVEG